MAESHVQNQGSTQPRLAREFEGFLKSKDILLYSKFNDKHFVCIPEVKNYLGASNYKVLRELLDALYDGDVTKMPDYKDVFEKYIATLCILINIQKGHLIHSFVEKTLIDERMPFSVKAPDNFPLDSDADGDDKMFLRRFCEEQWTFLAISFKENMSKKFLDEEILPITTMERLSSGGSGEVFKIEIPRCYNLRDEQYENTHCISFLDTFALKKYFTSESRSFEYEVGAYKKLASAAKPPPITKYFGDFQHKEDLCVIMELADQNLEQYFKETPPPSEPQDILYFWERLTEITFALSGVHSYTYESNGNMKMESGCHYDVKPENILVFSEGKASDEYRFKLTDFGISKFKKTIIGGEEPLDLVGCGTIMYGAPECFKFNDYLNAYALVRTKVDIWSFACILSEAVVWMAKNYAGLRKYREQRERDESRSSHPGLSSCFHDGKEVLDVVLRAHAEAKRNLRASDHITARIIQIIEREVLLREPPRRCEARDLSFDFSTAIELAKQSIKKMMETPLSLSESRPQLNKISTHQSLPSPQTDPEGSQRTSQEDISRTQSEPQSRRNNQKQDSKRSQEDTSVLTLSQHLNQARNRLQKDDPKGAYIELKKANSIWEDGFAKTVDELLKHHQEICTAFTKTNWKIFEQDQSLSTEKKKQIIENAKFWANYAMIIERYLNPLKETCEASNYLALKLKGMSLT